MSLFISYHIYSKYSNTFILHHYYLKILTIQFNMLARCVKCCNRTANIVNSDHMAHLGTVWSGFVLFAHISLSKYVEKYGNYPPNKITKMLIIRYKFFPPKLLRYSTAVGMSCHWKIEIHTLRVIYQENTDSPRIANKFVYKKVEN